MWRDRWTWPPEGSTADDNEECLRVSALRFWVPASGVDTLDESQTQYGTAVVSSTSSPEIPSNYVVQCTLGTSLAIHSPSLAAPAQDANQSTHSYGNA